MPDVKIMSSSIAQAIRRFFISQEAKTENRLASTFFQGEREYLSIRHRSQPKLRRLARRRSNHH